MNITGSLIEAYLFCPRQAWLLSRQLTGDQNNDYLSIGRLISDKSFKRERKEILIKGGKIDIVKTNKGELILIEVKKSSKFINTAKMQLLFYMWQLEKRGHRCKGEIRIPTEKKIIKINLLTKEREKLKNLLKEIELIINLKSLPEEKFNIKCKKCAYFEFCWS